jgi:hypothetical protein
VITAGQILARSGEGWKSGPIGLATILVLCVAVYFLFKSMSKHLRKVREEFPVDPPAAPRPAARVEPQVAPTDTEHPPADHPSTSA